MKTLFFLFTAFFFVLTGCDDGDSGVKLNEYEEDVFYFTNMARTDPSGYATEYLTPGASNGAYEELSVMTPVAPLEIHEGLTFIAKQHSADLNNNCNKLQHESCDGTSFADRVRPYYSGSIAENAAWNYPTGESVVKGWIEDFNIPSLGHRRNLLNGSYQHIGIGQSGPYVTQDFGGGGE
ncbi:CAP domain-containing protein [Myxococcota bacterium]|nr:CAP domain-containing protein [Myxococcota bacterium]MBU1380127.1 CAP domain-containing protein [Myxococcota bacterium]MBU1497883.1 CAP domain-containing protein [Myxococcota bacterium]